MFSASGPSHDAAAAAMFKKPIPTHSALKRNTVSVTPIPKAYPSHHSTLTMHVRRATNAVEGKW